MSRHISIVDDDASIREALKGLMRSVRFYVDAFASAEEFLASERVNDTACLILDVYLPGMSGFELQNHLNVERRHIPIIFITAHADEVSRAASFKGRSDRLFGQTCSPGSFVQGYSIGSWTLKRGEPVMASMNTFYPNVKRFEDENTTAAKTAPDTSESGGSGFPGIVGNSNALRRVLDMVRVVAPTDATVLINGETGTGKELIAEAIHKSSGRSSGPFVKVNCAAIPAGLLESELFGHERGAYTGAVARGIGRFERAHRGTLFLDEIGDLPLELQPKLLRVMQERQFERLGGSATIHTDVRVVCATHRNLAEMVDKREFRADLFYRLSVFPIELPPLRERPEDIRC